MRNQSSSSMTTLFFSRTRSAWFITEAGVQSPRKTARNFGFTTKVVLLQEVVAQDGEHAGIYRQATRYSRPRLADGHGRWWLHLPHGMTRFHDKL